MSPSTTAAGAKGVLPAGLHEEHRPTPSRGPPGQLDLSGTTPSGIMLNNIRQIPPSTGGIAAGPVNPDSPATPTGGMYYPTRAPSDGSNPTSPLGTQMSDPFSAFNRGIGQGAGTSTSTFSSAPAGGSTAAGSGSGPGSGPGSGSGSGSGSSAGKRIGGREVNGSRVPAAAGSSKLLPQAPVIAPPTSSTYVYHGQQQPQQQQQQPRTTNYTYIGGIPQADLSSSPQVLGRVQEQGQGQAQAQGNSSFGGLHFPHHSIFNRSSKSGEATPAPKPDSAQGSSRPGQQPHPYPSAPPLAGQVPDQTPAPTSELAPFLFSGYADLKNYDSAASAVQPSPSLELVNPFDAMYTRQPHNPVPPGVQAEVFPQSQAFARTISHERRDANVAMPSPPVHPPATATATPAKSRGFFSSLIKRNKHSNDGTDSPNKKVVSPASATPSSTNPPMSSDDIPVPAMNFTSPFDPDPNANINASTSTSNRNNSGDDVLSQGNQAQFPGQTMGVPGIPLGPTTRNTIQQQQQQQLHKSSSASFLRLPGQIRRQGTVRGSIPLLRGKRSTTVSPGTSVAQGAYSLGPSSTRHNSSVTGISSTGGYTADQPDAQNRVSQELVLDMDFSQMQGIIDLSDTAAGLGGPMSAGTFDPASASGSGGERDSLPTSDFSFGNAADGQADTSLTDQQQLQQAAWAPPESWAVRKVEDPSRTADAILAETDPLEEVAGAHQEGVHQESSFPPNLSNAIMPATTSQQRRESTKSEVPMDAAALAARRGPIHQMRIYRGDWTFATVACGMNITTEGLMAVLARKFFLPSVANYQIAIQRNGLSRVLQSHERPFHIQKALLEQAGYKQEDKLEELGREDNSYLCRFIFSTISIGDYSDADVERENGGENTVVEHFDLSGRNLQTIPVVLYKHAGKIKSLDLSRNLSLDIPIDFIQSCPALESIVSTHNELSKVQTNIVAAKSLVFLDCSFNKMVELHDSMSDLANLVTLIIRNNRLSKLPASLAAMTSLRRINMSSNDFKVFPKELCELINLEDLDVSFNRITAIPNDIGRLTKLQRLLINNNRVIGSLPRAFRELQSLREIDVRFNQLTTLDILTELPLLESISAGHNAITVVEAAFPKAKLFMLDKCPVTKFSLLTTGEALTSLDLSMAKLPSFADEMFDQLKNLVKLVLDDNHLTYLPPQIAKLTKLQHLSCKNNQLTTLPDEIGQVGNLRFLDVHSNNIKSLPPSVWLIHGLVSLNASSNLLTAFPEPPVQQHSQSFSGQGQGPQQSSPGTPTTELPIDPDMMATSNLVASATTNAAAAARKGSVPSISSRSSNTMAQTLRYLYLGDNRLDDACFESVSLLQELRVLNLSFNDIFEVPEGALRRLGHLVELYLSGNELTSLPADDFEEMQPLRVLHLNANKLQSLPAELGKIRRLLVLDVGSNALKYNTANWPYDWNWNWNLDLKYLNLSGNKRLEIKPSNNQTVRDRNLSDFAALTKLRVLGLMDITLGIDSLPEETHDRRVRLSGTDISNMSYGQSDTLGRHDHLSTIDMVVPRFGGREEETIFAMFDGSEVADTGSKVAKHLQDFFAEHLAIELKRLRSTEDVKTAMRRAFLAFNKELGIQVTPSPVKKDLASGSLSLLQRPSIVSQLSGHAGPNSGVPQTAAHILGPQDRQEGAAVCLVYLVGKRAYVANTGDAVAVLSRADGSAKMLSVKHNAGDAKEVARIREAGGYVSRDGLVDDQLDVTRSIGYFHLAPLVQAAPHVELVDLTEEDEFIIMATKNLWEVMSLQTAVDIARGHHDDLMLAAQKLRDFAISYGAQGKISVMVLGVGDLFHRKSKLARARNASAARSGLGGLSAAGLPLTADIDDGLITSHKSRRRVLAQDNNSGVADSTLARLQREVAPPVGEVAMVFTDIKNSTLLWESHPVAMQASIKIHNGIMRRQLRAIGGYEVKTEGDAFMVCFSTTLSALLWCFSVQTQLLAADWPQEILDSPDGREIREEGDVEAADKSAGTAAATAAAAATTKPVIYRGISVRMGIHWGAPVCEVDPITKRMDYFGPMVNRAARISAVADGGQITVSADVVRDVEVLEAIYRRETEDVGASEGGRTASDAGLDEALLATIRKEMQMLRRVGFGIAPIGERRLKGLENAEFISLAYPASLKGRITYAEKQRSKEGKKTAMAGAGVLDYRHIVDVYAVVFRLENLCAMVRGNRSAQHAGTMSSLRSKVASAYSADDDDDRLGMALLNLLTRVENALAALSLHYSHATQHALEATADLRMEEILQAIQLYKQLGYASSSALPAVTSPAAASGSGSVQALEGEVSPGSTSNASRHLPTRAPSSGNVPTTTSIANNQSMVVNSSASAAGTPNQPPPNTSTIDNDKQQLQPKPDDENLLVAEGDDVAQGYAMYE
ncbi:cysteinyl-tRNA synthetase [Savitreella phatthalungensis]